MKPHAKPQSANFKLCVTDPISPALNTKPIELKLNWMLSVIRYLLIV